MPQARDSVRTALLCLCALAGVLVAVAFWMALNTFGDIGVNWEPAATPFVERVASIVPGSPGERAGLRVGDTVDTRVLSPAQRLRFYAGELRGQPVVLPIERDKRARTVTVLPWSETQSAFWRVDGWDQELSIVGELWQIAVAALLLWRRPRDTEVRILALILVLPQLGVAIAPQLNNWVSPWPILDLVCYAISTPIIVLGTSLLATYALRFGRPISPLRRSGTPSRASAFTPAPSTSRGPCWVSRLSRRRSRSAPYCCP